ncbi:hypothetical protein TIFTF001_017465 [Ficus carica]|uniref:Uncharacterized protein n=1 Tax=Ficus carica TaxID=3494 RepID=A0AA88DAS4_FICCA|nr:hypothetical protein TIFTF001_017465 [Ficus carica]
MVNEMWGIWLLIVFKKLIVVYSRVGMNGIEVIEYFGTSIPEVLHRQSCRRKLWSIGEGLISWPFVVGEELVREMLVSSNGGCDRFVLQVLLCQWSHLR